jgi:hypothetical protein
VFLETREDRSERYSLNFIGYTSIVNVDPAVRQRFDQTFMELLAAVRVEVLDAKPPAFAAQSQVAAMFFKESQKSVLQDLAQLTASWGQSRVEIPVIERAMKTLGDMGLETAQERLGKLKELENAQAVAPE